MRTLGTLGAGALVGVAVSYGAFAFLSPEVAESVSRRSQQNPQSVDRTLKGDRLDTPANGLAKQPTRHPSNKPSHSLTMPPGCEPPFSAILSRESQAGRCAT